MSLTYVVIFMLEKHLQKLNISKKDAEVYIFCLKQVQTNPTNIVRSLHIPRSTVYTCLEHLEKNDLIGYRIKGRRKYLFALSPKKAFAHFIRKKKEKIRGEEKNIQKILKDIQLLPRKSVSQSESFSYFEDKAGILYVIDKILKEKKDIFWIGSLSVLLSEIGEDELYKKMTLNRLKQNTTSYAITDRNILSNKKIGEQIGTFRQYAFLKKEGDSPGLMVICGSLTAIFSKKGKRVKVIVIEDTLISQMMLFIFQNLWDSLKK